MKTTEDVQAIIQKLANAKVTCGCGGHYKGAMNKNLVKEYKKELAELGAEIPTDKELYAIGKFNGEGSY